MVATPGEIDALPGIVAAAVTNPKNALYSGISAIEATLKKTASLRHMSQGMRVYYWCEERHHIKRLFLFAYCGFSGDYPENSPSGLPVGGGKDP